MDVSNAANSWLNNTTVKKQKIALFIDGEEKGKISVCTQLLDDRDDLR
jgi:hypothetical protein